MSNDTNGGHGSGMTGAELVALMRTNGVTIRALAERMKISMEQVRRRRDGGRMDLALSCDYAGAVLGTDENKWMRAYRAHRAWREAELARELEEIRAARG